jgi:hypothetical protein
MAVELTAVVAQGFLASKNRSWTHTPTAGSSYGVVTVTSWQPWSWAKWGGVTMPLIASASSGADWVYAWAMPISDSAATVQIYTSTSTTPSSIAASYSFKGVHPVNPYTAKTHSSGGPSPQGVTNLLCQNGGYAVDALSYGHWSPAGTITAYDGQTIVARRHQHSGWQDQVLGRKSVSAGNNHFRYNLTGGAGIAAVRALAVAINPSIPGGGRIWGGVFIEKAKEIMRGPLRESFPLEEPTMPPGWDRKEKGLLVPQGI